MVYRVPSPPQRTPSRARQIPGFRQIARFILALPVRAGRVILLLPVRLVRSLARLPRLIWRAWTRGALHLYRLRKIIARLPEAYRWLKLRTPLDRVKHALYFRLHPRRFWHGVCCLGTRLRGKHAWAAAPGLDVIPKALRWAHQYRRHAWRFRDIEALRSTLYVRETPLATSGGTLPIGYLARRNSTHPRWGALLHGLVFYSQAQRVLELGTGFGVSGMYLARGLLDVYPIRTCMLVTIEREEQFARIAYEHFRRLGFDDFVHVLRGSFENGLEEALKRVEPVSLAFIDGHHEENATLRYFSQIKARARTGALIVLDDIHWSPGMARAWRTIQDMPHVAATVDLWRWGIVVVGSGPAVHRCARL